MVNAFSCLLKKKITGTLPLNDDEIEKLGHEIRQEINTRFGRSLAIREWTPAATMQQRSK